MRPLKIEQCRAFMSGYPKILERKTMFGTRESICQTLIEMYSESDSLALLVMTPDCINAIADGLEQPLTEPETMKVLEMLGTLPEDDSPLSGVCFDTVADLIHRVKSETRLINVPAGLLEKLVIAAEQALWQQEWQARDTDSPVPEHIVRRLANVAQVRELLKR
ncbi:TPA: DUF1380 family protein [Yersinia enterocolitica]